MTYGHSLQPHCTTHPERVAVTRDGDALMCMACSLQAMQTPASSAARPA